LLNTIRKEIILEIKGLFWTRAWCELHPHRKSQLS
jgi:hypothetical protein